MEKKDTKWIYKNNWKDPSDPFTYSNVGGSEEFSWFRNFSLRYLTLKLKSYLIVQTLLVDSGLGLVHHETLFVGL